MDFFKCCSRITSTKESLLGMPRAISPEDNPIILPGIDPSILARIPTYFHAESLADFQEYFKFFYISCSKGSSRNDSSSPRL